MPSKLRQLIIKLTTGIESPEKLSQAFTVAATALASGGGFRPSWQHLRFEVLLAWALRAPAADKPTYPLKPFTLGPGFLSTLDGLQGIQRSKVVDVVVEVVTGLVAQFRPRQLCGPAFSTAALGRGAYILTAPLLVSNRPGSARTTTTGPEGSADG